MKIIKQHGIKALTANDALAIQKLLVTIVRNKKILQAMENNIVRNKSTFCVDLLRENIMRVATTELATTLVIRAIFVMEFHMILLYQKPERPDKLMPGLLLTV